jgi:hypothetical protein
LGESLVVLPHRDLAGLRWGFLLGLPAQHGFNILNQDGFVNLILYIFSKESEMAKKAVKPQHGGARPGSGRKPANPEGKTMMLAVSVPEALVAKLDELAARNEWGRSKAVTEAIRGLVSAGSRPSGERGNRTQRRAAVP